MKVMVIVKANADSEAGRMPSEQELSEMGAFNEQLVAAGIMLAGEGLHATQRGRRIHFGSGAPRVEAGPFGPAGDQIAGFWCGRCGRWTKRLNGPAARRLAVAARSNCVP